MKTLLLNSCLLCCLGLTAQDSAGVPDKFSLQGYIKNLETVRFDKDFRESVSGNLFHNRINIRYRPHSRWTLDAQFRNRLFWGEEIKLTPAFAKNLRNPGEKFSLSVTWLDRKSLLLHTNTERLSLEYRAKNWNVKAGRQRINWGIATTWNPNDIFNSYNFLDFDYEERPGADALKLQYNLRDFSGLELVTAFAGTGNKTNGALRYTTHTGQYDLQFIAGWFRDRFTLGTGWAGNIRKAGFKGEMQLYLPAGSAGTHFNAVLESDHAFAGGWYVNAGLLFNSRGLTEKVKEWEEVDLQLTPENLMPARWNFLAGAMKEITPLFSGRLAVVYSPEIQMLILFPSFQYNMATNLDASISWQSFFLGTNRFEAVTHMPFVRLKWSF